MINRTGRGKRILVWMRRALRVQDNTPLWHAIEDGADVIPLVVVQDDPLYARNTPRRRLVVGAMRNLDADIRSKGSSLCVLRGEHVSAITGFAIACKADAVYASRVYDPAGLERDARIKDHLGKKGIQWMTFKDIVLQEGEQVLTGGGMPYRVFTPYKRAWLAVQDTISPLLPLIRRIPKSAVASSLSGQLPQMQFNNDEAGSSVAQKRLRQFVQDGIGTYGETRNNPGLDGTSRLSAHLSHGTISIRQVYHAAIAAMYGKGARWKENVETFLNELIWREFYYQVLSNYPRVSAHAFRSEFDALPWSKNKKHFAAWCEGRTGYPMVDAGMRQLVTEGWMHNRVRMIAASFLTKDLHISWQWGEQFFLEHLVDGDIASNNGGWQWTAGTGTDASPWFRIFNPVTQSEKFDPEGVYVRKYVPELAEFPPGNIHKPWELKTSDQEKYGCRIGKDYPAPIVDHATEREVTKTIYQTQRMSGKN